MDKNKSGQSWKGGTVNQLFSAIMRWLIKLICVSWYGTFLRKNKSKNTNWSGLLSHFVFHSDVFLREQTRATSICWVRRVLCTSSRVATPLQRGNVSDHQVQADASSRRHPHKRLMQRQKGAVVNLEDQWKPRQFSCTSYLGFCFFHSECVRTVSAAH